MAIKYKTDDIDKFFDYDLSIPTRTIFIGSADSDEEGESGVDAAMLERVVKCMHILDNFDADSKTGKSPITIVMNNPGGYTYDAMGIYDAIRASKNHVTIKVVGVAMSAGTVILQAADKRVLSPNSSFMIHYGEHGGSYHSPTVHKWNEEAKRIDKWLEDLYIKRIREKHPKFRRDKLKGWLTTDTFFTAQEAVDWGFADEVG
jgi:ATP-dependent protease ClpP protease subunit